MSRSLSRAEVRVNTLIELLLAHAPGQAEKEQLHKLYGDILFTGAPDDEVEKIMAGFLCLGLNKGEWPWTK